MILIVILVSIAVIALWLGFADAEARRAADYTYREQAGKLTAEELDAEAAEERENYNERTSGKDMVW